MAYTGSFLPAFSNLPLYNLTLYMTGGTADTITCESATIRLEHCS